MRADERRGERDRERCVVQKDDVNGDKKRYIEGKRDWY